MKHYEPAKIGDGYTVVDENDIVAVTAPIMPLSEAQQIADDYNEIETFIQMAKTFIN